MGNGQGEELSAIAAEYRAGVIANDHATQIARAVRMAIEELARVHSLKVSGVYIDIDLVGPYSVLNEVRIETTTGGVWHGQAS